MSKRFAAQPDSSRAAREFVAQHLERIGADTWTASLLVSELATNAIEHVGAAFTVEVGVDPVRVSVTDAGPQTDLRVVLPREDDPRGRGLVLMDALSSRWGVTHHPRGGKTIWFELGEVRSRRRSGPAAP